MIDLYVDDVRVCPDGWCIARDIRAAKEWLKTGVVEHLSLDHDMGACPDCVAARKDCGDMLTPETTFWNWCPHEEDGTALVHWMIENDIWPKYKPVVHSANPVGAARMRGMIDRYWHE
jgi:hypothetical protein